MSEKTIKIEITLIEEMLGTSPMNPEIYAEWVAMKSADAEKMEEELAALSADELETKGMTGFLRDPEGNPLLWDFQIKGSFKAACKALRRVPDKKSVNLKAFLQVINTLIFPQPRCVPLVLPEGAEVGRCVRPLRAQTAQGERVSLVCSESVPRGTKAQYEVFMYDHRHTALIEEWLDYGFRYGIGQWRNSGKGKFTWDLLED